MARRTVAEWTALLAAERGRVAALERERVATAAVLRAIGRSGSDEAALAAVLGTIVDQAARLARADQTTVYRAEGVDVVAVAGTGQIPVGTRLPLDRGVILGHAILDHRAVHVGDMWALPEDEMPRSRRIAMAAGFRTLAAFPLERAGRALGAFTIGRRAAEPFGEDELALVATFADQAAIALENARLFAELQERLEEQTATSEVLRAISQSPTDREGVLRTIAETAARLCEAVDSNVVLVAGSEMEVVASTGTLPVGRRVPLIPGNIAARPVLERRTVHVPDLWAAEDEYPYSTPIAREWGTHTYLVAPLLRQDEAIGIIMIRRTEVRPFSDQQVRLLESFADQAVIAIENARLFAELNDSNASLTEALEQQTATAQVLSAISHAPTDLQGVLDTIAASAARLVGARNATLLQCDGDLLVSRAAFGPEATAHMQEHPRMPYGRGSLTRLAQDERRVVHLPDVSAPEAAAAFPGALRTSARFNARALLCVPLTRADDPVGSFILTRPEPGPFSDREIELVQVFADQAVIAIENSRLFGDLQARTGELTRSVERLTALFEVGRTISSTLDLEQVLERVVARAAELADAAGGALWEIDRAAGLFRLRVMHGIPTELEQVWRQLTAPVDGDGMLARLAAERAPQNLADVLERNASGTQIGDLYRASGTRATLALPLLREDEVLGALVVRRTTPGAFDADTVALLQTFATQSALAIQNARLFAEIEEKSRQLEQASRHKSEFLANMSHELRTPLNAIIGFSELLAEEAGDIGAEAMVPDLGKINSAGKHLLSLINDILDLSKVEAGRMDLELTEFDLAQALDAGRVMLTERAERKGLRLVLHLPEDLGRIEADERKVKQVLFNLLTNAVKFTPEGGVVTVSARRLQEQVEVSVTDTGVGIAQEDRDKVFEEFGQAKNQDGQTEGTGLGLTLCKRFVELHGGRMRVESTIGRGSTFTFALPVRRAVLL